MTHRSYAVIRIIASAAAVALLMGSCSVYQVSRHVTLAGTPGMLSSRQDAALFSALQRKFADCMRDRGFRYWPLAPPLLAEPDLFPYVITNVSWARAHAFGGTGGVLASATGADAAPALNSRYAGRLSPSRRISYLLAENGNGPNDPGDIARLPDGQLVGYSKRSCYVRSGNALFSHAPGWFQQMMTYQALPGLWQQDVQADPRFAAAVRSWSRCMAGRHIPFASPAAAAAVFQQPSRGGSRQARRAAVSEASCAGSSSLGRVSSRLDTYYRKKAEFKYALVIRSYRQLVLGALARAGMLPALTGAVPAS